MKSDMSRREFVAAATALTCATRVGNAEAAEPPKQPNVLIIHVDEHRIECLGAYGNSDIRTPHVDSLARDGVRYEQSFCPYPVCTPSRYSLLSGLYVHEHRGASNHCTLPPGTATFPSELKKAGYRTKAVGKMHFTPTYLDVGFEELVLSEQNGPGRWDDDYHRDLKRNGLVNASDLEDQERDYRKVARPEYWETFGALPSNLPEAFHSTTWIGDRAVETLEQWGDSGNLLMAGFVKPHHPFDPPKEWCDAYDPAKLELLPGWLNECLPHDLALSKGYFPHEGLNEKALRRVMAYYYATIEQIDHHVGRMIDVLKRKGVYDNTLIIFTADHGDYMGFHHMLLKGNHMYDPVVKVPLIVKFPGNAQEGTVSKALVNNIDLAPTILRQAGCTPPDAMGGADLAQADAGHEYAFSEKGKAGSVMARNQTHKLLLSPEQGTAFLYDLEKDPTETVNRYEDAAYADVVRELTSAVRQWRPEGKRVRPYVDEEAPVIDQPNVQTRKGSHRREMMQYCREKMAEITW